MIEDQFLNLFINEPIYRLSDEPLAPARETQPEPPILKEPAPPAPPVATKTKIHSLAIWTPPLTTQDRELLTKIMKAVHENLEECYLMEGISAYEPNYQKLICFGYQQELELKTAEKFELYKPSLAADKQILVSVAPAELHESKSEKASLWKALQEMFPG